MLRECSGQRRSLLFPITIIHNMARYPIISYALTSAQVVLSIFQHRKALFQEGELSREQQIRLSHGRNTLGHGGNPNGGIPRKKG